MLWRLTAGNAYQAIEAKLLRCGVEAVESSNALIEYLFSGASHVT